MSRNNSDLTASKIKKLYGPELDMKKFVQDVSVSLDKMIIEDRTRNKDYLDYELPTVFPRIQLNTKDAQLLFAFELIKIYEERDFELAMIHDSKNDKSYIRIQWNCMLDDKTREKIKNFLEERTIFMIDKGDT